MNLEFNRVIKPEHKYSSTEFLQLLGTSAEEQTRFLEHTLS